MRHAPQTRASLILRLRNRDDLDAWQQFTEIYQPLVFRLARRKGFQDSDAADVAQEVLLRVAGAVERFDPDASRGSFRGWLFQIARNLMITFLQKDQKRPIAGGPEQLVALIENQADPSSLESRLFDEEYERQVFAWATQRIRSLFQDSTWQAFQRTAIEQESAAGVAAELGMTVGAVYIARSRVMKRLREEVQLIMNSPQDSAGRRGDIHHEG